jgi:5-oxoprolinase (ATP-hydrolysing)
VQRGYDVTEYVLNVFGGAGGQHACAVADALGMTRVLIHPLAGVLSAYGIGLADIIAMREQAVEAPLTRESLDALPETTGPLEQDARAEVAAEGVPPERITAAHRAHLRYQGTDTAVIVPVGSLADMTAAFEAEYARRFSFLMRDKPVIVEAVSVEVTGTQNRYEDADDPARSAQKDPERVSMFTGGAWAEVDLYERSGLRPGHVIDGPAILTEELATTVVEPGWQAVVTDRGDLLMSRVTARPAQADVSTEADPVMLEIFNNLFMSVAEQMGVRLQSTAHSVNIKERLDFSCAVFDADGGLIANAPHMPVHLGSMGESIKMVIKRNRGPAGVQQHRRRLCWLRGGRNPDPPRAPPKRPDLVLRRLSRASRRDRGSDAGIHAGRQHPGRGRGGADRQLAAGAGPAAAGSRDH